MYGDKSFCDKCLRTNILREKTWKNTSWLHARGLLTVPNGGYWRGLDGLALADLGGAGEWKGGWEVLEPSEDSRGQVGGRGDFAEDLMSAGLQMHKGQGRCFGPVT